MCYPCRCPRRSVSCHGGGVCCPRPCCRERSRSTCSPRVIFPGEFQKFSDMIPPSFLLKQPPKCEKVKKKSNCDSQAAKRKKAADCNDTGNGDNVCDPEEARAPGECVEMPGVPGIPFQPTGTPWCGTNGPWEYPMAFDMPPQPQWVCFECPATVCFPREPQGLPAAGLPAAGLPPAGLPTKRSPPFNPCTGQVYHCEHQQMMVGNNNEIAQCPANNQFCHGLNICIGPANSCYQCNPSNFGVGAISNEPNRNQPYYQSNQGINMGYGNVGMATETRKGMSSRQSQQYNQRNYGEGANLYEANRDQTYSQFCHGINMCPGNPYYPYDCGDGTYRPPPGDPRSLSPQVDSRSKVQRKGNEKETREGNVVKATESRKGPIGGQRRQYTQDNRVEGANRPSRGQIYMDPRRVPQQNPTSGHVSPGGKRSSSQGTRNESREAPRLSRNSRSNSLTAREKSIDRTKKIPQVKQSGRVAQQNSAASRGVSQYGNRSRSQTRGNQSIEAPRPNNQNQYNSYISSKEPTSPRVSLRSNSSGNQVPRSSYRSKSLEPRNEKRRDSSARVPHPCKSRSTSPDRATNGNGRSKSLGKRSEPREQRSINMPASNLNFYQQNMGMSFGPSNQHYIADCPLPDPIYTTQLESTVGDSGWGKRNESPRGNSTRKNGESRKECKCKESSPGNQSARGSPPHQMNQCLTLRFNPNNQYCQYYVPDECSSPPSPEILRPYGEKSHDRTNKSRSLDDRQMSTSSSKSSKKQPASSANKNANVLVLKTQKNEEKKQIQNDSAETLDLCSTTTQDEDSSCESLEDSCICAVMVNDNGKEKDKKKAQEKDKKKAEGQSNSDGSENSGCPNCCWMRCPNSWSCRCGPCNSPYSGQWNRSCKGPCNGPCGSPCGSSRNCPYHYCGNCCNGCRQCCNYRCSPCGRYCCSKPPTSQGNSGKASPKSSKDKPAGRNQGGLSGPSRAFPVPSFSTMPGYYPTMPPQFISPYSGHWKASEVVSNPMFPKHYP